MWRRAHKACKCSCSSLPIAARHWHSSPPIHHAFALQYHSLPLAITRDYTLPLLTKISLIATHCPTSPLTAAHQRLSSLIKPQATQRGERVGRRCSSRVGAHHHSQALPSISASLHDRSSEAVLTVITLVTIRIHHSIVTPLSRRHHCPSS